MQKGDQFYGRQGLLIVVNRVSKAQEWADITVYARGGTYWTKRQPLVNGGFAFQAEKVGA